MNKVDIKENIKIAIDALFSNDAWLLENDFCWSKQRNLCMGHWQFGGYLVVEFDGNGKFRILKGIKDDRWRDC